jgi:hypothetical protein
MEIVNPYTIAKLCAKLYSKSNLTSKSSHMAVVMGPNDLFAFFKGGIKGCVHIYNGQENRINYTNVNDFIDNIPVITNITLFLDISHKLNERTR